MSEGIQGRLAALADEIRTTIATADPQSAQEYGDLFAGLEGIWAEASTGLGTLGASLDGGSPLHPVLREGVHEGGAAVAGVRDRFAELTEQYRVRHAEDLRRSEEPRPGEEKMNYNPGQ